MGTERCMRYAYNNDVCAAHDKSSTLIWSAVQCSALTHNTTQHNRGQDRTGQCRTRPYDMDSFVRNDMIRHGMGEMRERDAYAAGGGGGIHPRSWHHAASDTGCTDCHTCVLWRRAVRAVYDMTALFFWRNNKTAENYRAVARQLSDRVYDDRYNYNRHK